MTSKTDLNSTTALQAPSTAGGDRLIANLNERFETALNLGAKSDREKLLVIVEGWLFVEKTGGPKHFSLSPLYNGAGIERSGSAAYNEAAQLITGRVIRKFNDKRAKKNARSIVDRAAVLMEALRYFAGESSGAHIANLNAEQISDWIGCEGGVEGVIARFKKETMGEGDIAEETVIDLEEHRRAVQRTNLRFKAPEDLNAPDPGLALFQRDEDDMLVAPLEAVPAELMDQLRPYLPAPDMNVPSAIRLWGSVARFCQLFDRRDSAVPLRPSEEQHSGSLMAPSFPIVRVLGADLLSIAASRVDAGLVVVVKSTEIGLADHVGSHLNGRATSELSTNLASPSARGSFSDVTIEGDKEGRDWLTFKSRMVQPADFRVRLLPMSQFGRSVPQWTLGIRDTYSSSASTGLTLEGDRLPKAILTFAGKASGSGNKHPVWLRIKGGALSLALGKSSGHAIPSEGEPRDAAVKIAAVDLARVLEVIGDLRFESVVIEIDPKGMAAFRVLSSVGEFAIYIPAITDGGERVPALLDRITKSA